MQFFYLGSYVSPCGRITDDESDRIQKARLAFANLRHVRLHRRLSVKRRVYVAAVRPVLFYVAETWSLREHNKVGCRCLNTVVYVVLHDPGRKHGLAFAEFQVIAVIQWNKLPRCVMFDETGNAISRLNKLFDEAEAITPGVCMENALGCLTAYLAFLCIRTHYEKVRVIQFVGCMNTGISLVPIVSMLYDLVRYTWRANSQAAEWI
ncbi:unnamed protein product [Echinostoma caproni]|uniref:Tyrosine-protein phosphatase domain-containing protein n=1 Tax=Echinostoma caproni TaxID=27848 RepID=A0A183AS98_9TREM|nr:unnamed protein product [Echinostoma caproni]